MSHPRRHAAALLVALALSVPAPALAAEPRLLAQIEDATPTPQPQPPLTEEPPTDLDGGEEPGDDEGDGTENGGNGGNGGDTADPLPETGLDAGLVALLGLGLIASGSGLRLTLVRGHAR